MTTDKTQIEQVFEPIEIPKITSVDLSDPEIWEILKPPGCTDPPPAKEKAN